MTSPGIPDTGHYGLTRVGEGENLSKSGWAALNSDRIVIDSLLNALENHTHSAEPRLADPIDPPTLEATTTGGSLPSGVTAYYSVAYVDKWGLETAASPEAGITMPSQVTAPTAPSLTLYSTGGSLTPGRYTYVLTAVGMAGETNASTRAEVVIESGSTSRIEISLPDLPTNAEFFRLYRARPGQPQLHRVMDEIVDDHVTDDGSVHEDCDLVVPVVNDTGSTASVTIDIGELPEGAVSWKIYRTFSPGNYSSASLVHNVVEGLSDLDPTVRTTWVDAGDNISLGVPRRNSATISGGRLIDFEQMHGQLPMSVLPRGAGRWDTFVPGTVEPGEVYGKTKFYLPFRPLHGSAYFNVPPTTGTGSQIGFSLTDEAGNEIVLVGSASGGSGTEKYFSSEWPRVESGVFEAEQSIDPMNEIVVADDSTAVNGQAVNLSVEDGYVRVPLGELTPGTYLCIVRTKAVGAPVVDDLSFALVDSSDSSVASRSATPLEDTWGNVELPVVIDTTDEYAMIITKTLADEATYYIDQVSYEIDAPVLQAGEITLAATLVNPDGTPLAPKSYSDYSLRAEKRRVIVKENEGDTVDITVNTSTSDSVTWTVVSDQTWATLSSSSGTGASITTTVTVDFDAIRDVLGGRGVATITFTSTGGFDSETVEVVALGLMDDPGQFVNVSLVY